MSNKHKGILIFTILYTVLFVFDGVHLFDFLLSTSITNYLAYTGIFLYGCFLFKSELIQKWNEIKVSSRKFWLGALKYLLLLFLMTFFFAFLSELLRQTLGLGGVGQNETNIQNTFRSQPLLLLLFSCVVGPAVEELFFRQVLLHWLGKYLSSWLSIFLVGLVFSLTHMHSLSLSEWISAVSYLGGGLVFSIIYVKEKENIYYPLLVHILGNSLSFMILVISNM